MVCSDLDCTLGPRSKTGTGARMHTGERRGNARSLGQERHLTKFRSATEQGTSFALGAVWGVYAYSDTVSELALPCTQSLIYVQTG